MNRIANFSNLESEIPHKYIDKSQNVQISQSFFLAKKTVVTFLVTLKEEFHRINTHNNISQKQQYSNFTETAGKLFEFSRQTKIF